MYVDAAKKRAAAGRAARHEPRDSQPRAVTHPPSGGRSLLADCGCERPPAEPGVARADGIPADLRDVDWHDDVRLPWRLDEKLGDIEKRVSRSAEDSGAPDDSAPSVVDSPPSGTCRAAGR